MKTRMTIVSIMLLACSFVIAQAQGKEKIQNYFNETAIQVRATSDPAQKREILNKSLVKMTNALEVVERMNSVPDNDRAGILKLKTSLIEKQHALAGTNGLKRVADEKLNDFANYIVQDIEQANVITISVVTLLLIIIIIILLV